MSTRLLNYYDELDALGLPMSEPNKLRHLRARIKMGGANKEPYYISVWQDKVDKAILDHISAGTEIEYTHWTTRLVNDEAKFKKSTKNDSARISAASTGGRDHQGGSSGGGIGVPEYNKSTGEPLGGIINGMNITLFYGDIDKMNSEGKFIPKVTKDWFKSNKTKMCPQKFKDIAKEVTGSVKYKKKFKQKERKIAAAAAARDGDDDAELCSASPN